MDKQSTDGHYTLLWSCEASIFTGVANLLTEMARVLFC